MRVLILLSNPFKPDPRVLKEAETLVNAGYSVTILAWDRETKYPTEEEVKGIKIVRFAIPSGYGESGSFVRGIIKYYLAVLRWVMGKKYDIIHANDFDTLPLAVALKKLHGWPIIYDAHDLYEGMIAEVVPAAMAKFVGWLERRLLKFTDGRMAATGPLAKILFRDDYEVIMNAKKIEEYRLPEERIEEARKEINPEGLFTVLYIGVLDLSRPLPLIIEAVRDLEGVQLVIGGKGPHEKEIMKMIEGMKNIRYIGWVQRDKIPAYTLASDLIILTPNPNKTYTRIAVANKLMEALAAGKPVISSAGTAGGEIVKECNAGLLCRHGDVNCLRESIMRLMSNRLLYDELARNAMRCAEEKYNWKAMEDRLLRLYSRVAKR